MHPKVSVIIPIYNVEEYLSQCMNSVISQTLKEIEIICVNDGSTDSSGDILDEFAKIDNRITVINQPNSGLVNARKMGLSLAKAEYISYVDSDDWICSDMLETLYNAANESGVDIVSCGYYMESGEQSSLQRDHLSEGIYSKKQMEQIIYPEMLSYFLKNNGKWSNKIRPQVWNKLFRREKLLRHQTSVCEKITIGEDAAVVYPYLLDANSIYVLDKYLYHYRFKRPASIMNSYEPHYLARIDALYSYLYCVFQKSAYGKIMIPQLNKFIERMVFLAPKRLFGHQIFLNSESYIFPFDLVKRNSNIVIYAAGMVGCYYYRQVMTTSYCNKILWVDKNSEKYRSMGFPVQDVEQINSFDYNIVIIAVESEKLASNIKNELIEIGVPEEKIIWKNPDIITI